jgi:hypothetical protein
MLGGRPLVGQKKPWLTIKLRSIPSEAWETQKFETHSNTNAQVLLCLDDAFLPNQLAYINKRMNKK